jgi:hypothetical protein
MSSSWALRIEMGVHKGDVAEEVGDEEKTAHMIWYRVVVFESQAHAWEQCTSLRQVHLVRGELGG